MISYSNMYHISNTQQNTPEDELDERWDTNYGFTQPSSEQSIKALGLSFQNLSMNQKEVSPPLTAEKKVVNNESLNTACFREELSDDEDDPSDYFKCNPPAVELIQPTPASSHSNSGDYLSAQENRKQVEDEDLSITALNDLSPIECINVLTKQDEIYSPTQKEEEEKKAPTSFADYHSNLVQYYIDAILRKTDPHTISAEAVQSLESTLPSMYKTYLQEIRKSMSVPYGCM